MSYEDLSEAEILIRNSMNAAVPIFLAVSGFFCAKKKFCCKTDYYSFLKKQIPRVYIPVLFCSLPLLIVTLKTKGTAFSSFLIYFSCGFSVYYFIALIIQLYLLSVIVFSKNQYLILSVFLIVSIRLILQDM